MGEFVVDSGIYEDKMGETAASNPSLQVSVSFGRFENDSLSWEKWSAFSPNKYLEEVEKCATPGSVAQKKAYFEAHYKKIAARKVELLGQEKQTDKDPLRSEDQIGEDLRGICGNDAEFDVSNSQSPIEGVQQEIDSIGEISGTHVDNLEEEDTAVSKDYQISSVEGDNKELENRSDSSQVDKPEEAVWAKEEQIPTFAAEDVKEISHKLDNEIGQASEIEAKDVKLDHLKGSKVTSVNRESNAAKTKNKPVLPMSKASQISVPRSSRSPSIPTKTLASASSTKKGNSPSLSGRKSTSTGDNKRIANKSLHMSLSLGPSKPDPAPLTTTTMRKSFIMDKMGDKEIVKRAFKTFQNNFNQPTLGEDRSLIKKQVPSRGTERRAQTSMALRKENGWSTKDDSMNKRSGNAVQTSMGLKSDIRADKGKEFSKKIEQKSNAKEAERIRLQSKLKEEKEAEIKKLKHNFKATPLPAFYRSQKVSKSRPEKGDVKSENPR